MDDNQADQSFVPALGFHRLTALYDPLIRRWGAAAKMRASVVEALALVPGQSVLELGAGPGRLAMDIKREEPDVDVHALDADPSMVRLGLRNAEREGVEITYRVGDMTKLDGTRQFDRIVSTMTFHHLSPEAKIAALRCARRALLPDGVFVVCDFGRQRGWLQLALFSLIQQPLDGFRNTTPHRNGAYERAVREAFGSVRSEGVWRTAAGTLEMFVCRGNS